MIRARALSKEYPLYAAKQDKIREAFSFSGRSFHTAFAALRGVSFSIGKGECVGLIGLNGAGKSTLLKILAGVLRPTGGELQTRGRISSLLELGAGFHPEYTGRENIFLSRSLAGFSDRETKAVLEEILSFADIGRFIDQPVKKYSSGMFVRLAFAVAMSVSPDIMLIDEALSVGDIFFQKKCIARLEEMKAHATVIIASHDMNTLTKFCGRILVLSRGVLVYDGEPREAVTCYCRIRQGEVENRQLMESGRLLDPDREEPFSAAKNWQYPKAGQLSGKMDMKIAAFAWTCDGVPQGETIRPGSLLHVRLLIRTDHAAQDLIIGYQVLDRHGTEVFGETSLTSGFGLTTLKEGESTAEFFVRWPLVRDGDYFITLGIGTGTAVLSQTEQCWVNSAVHLVNVTGGTVVYGLFNRAMSGLQVSNVGEDRE